jgi:DNA-binding transcriptional LysR family regulator
MFYMFSMREVNLSGVDLNLLPLLDALLRRRNVTQAALDAGLSQPAMSRALARLRHLLGDPLLVRDGGGLVPTPLAQALHGPLAEAMADLRALLTRQAFDPAQSQRTIRLAATDAHGVRVMPGVMARLGREAPGIRLRVEGYGPDLVERMRAGRVDLAFAVSGTPLPPGAESETLARDELALVFRRGHPGADLDWTPADYARFDHAAVSLIGDDPSDIDARLAGLGVQRRVAFVSPSFSSALAVVGSSDLVTTMSRAVALRHADAFGLELRVPPFGRMAYDMTLVWTAVRAADPLLGWFRGVVRDAAREALEPIGAGDPTDVRSGGV